jgi:hypothetical protein
MRFDEYKSDRKARKAIVLARVDHGRKLSAIEDRETADELQEYALKANECAATNAN